MIESKIKQVIKKQLQKGSRVITRDSLAKKYNLIRGDEKYLSPEQAQLFYNDLFDAKTKKKTIALNRKTQDLLEEKVILTKKEDVELDNFIVSEAVSQALGFVQAMAFSTGNVPPVLQKLEQAQNILNLNLK